ncbi:winged helix-turn-helix domain-containing protein [Burkholderia pseudomultivorans]|uniref:winged helix-turn-helix domain-containing protein n=1 Tax=Burkholderia pseudomultivorans TaxID=1207504 RepID=UPI000B0A908A|nr:winged helix-turn-helix domain-containing protein [Burkholderia pseudomultivorans]
MSIATANILVLCSKPNIIEEIFNNLEHRAINFFTAPSLAKTKPILRKINIDIVVVTDWVADVMLEDIQSMLADSMDYNPILIHVRSPLLDSNSGTCLCGLDDCISASKDLARQSVFLREVNEIADLTGIITRPDWRARRVALNVKGYHFIPSSNKVIHNGEIIQLRQKEFDLAYLIFTLHGEVVARDEIMDVIWPGDTTKTFRNIVPHVSSIRQRLSLTPENGLIIRSIYGEGYRLEECRPATHNGGSSVPS